MNDSSDSLPDYTHDYSQFYDSSSDDLGFEERNPICAEVSSEQPRYSDCCEIGRGGMKRISRVYDHSSGRYVAIAQLHADATPDAYESFLREARLTASLQHPNIIPVYDVGLLDEAPFFTMELKTGNSLRDWVADGTPSTRAVHERRSELLEIFLKVCDAVSYAHSRSVLHLDLKPANIQIGKFGGVMVCDWGLSKIIGDPDDALETKSLDPDLLNAMTLDGNIKGTPGYMAPEQLEAGGDKTPLTDVFSLGATLYALLTGRNPGTENVETTFDKTRKGQLFEFGTVEHEKVPKSLRAVIRKATALVPAQRYQSVESLRKDVHQYLSGFPTFAEQAGFAKQLFLLCKRNKRTSFILLSVTCFTIAVTLYAFNQVQQERDAARVALDKYTKEKRYSSKLVKSYEQSVLGQAVLFQTSGLFSERVKVSNYKKVIQELDKVLAKHTPSLHSGSQNPAYHKAKLLVVMQNFEDADQCYKKFPKVYELCEELVAEFAEKYPGPTKKPAKVIVEFIRQLRLRYDIRRLPLAEKMMAYDALVRSDLMQHSWIVREVVRVFNPDWDNDQFDYSAIERTLVIGGRNLTTLFADFNTASGANILRTLKIDALTLRGPDFSDLSIVSKLSLSHLDIRETGITTLSDPEALTFVSELIYSPNQFAAEELAKFPAHVRLVERD